MALSRKSIYLNVIGSEPIYLGTFEDSKEFRQDLNDIHRSLGINIDFLFEDERPPRKRVAANPAPQYEDLRKLTDNRRALRLIEQAFKGPQNALNIAILNTERCTVGEPREISYPIKVNEVKDIPIDVAALHLAALIPKCSKRIPPKVLSRILNGETITQSELDKLSPSDRKAYKSAVNIYLEGVLRYNTKTAKNKVPAKLGLGKPAKGYSGYNEVATFGSQGLNFMPAKTLLQDDPEATQQDSFKTIVKKYLKATSILLAQTDGVQLLNAVDEDVQEVLTRFGESSNGFDPSELESLHASLTLLEATLDLDCFSGRVKPTACSYASKVCRAPCLVSTGRRATDFKDVFELKSYLAEGNTRMLLGYYQTGFLANPYYFLRVLIHSTYLHGAKHLQEICEYNVDFTNFLDGDAEPLNSDEYLKVLPPSVRLNMYSDYPWELIYPDYFEVFALDAKKRKTLKGYPNLGVQFYDYTKIPGRLATTQRKLLLKHFKLKWNNSFKYKIPENYHLTFSFSGTPKSYQHQQLSMLAGQAATVVFASSSLVGESMRMAFEKASKAIRGLTPKTAYDTKIFPLIKRIYSSLQESFGKGAVADLRKTPLQIRSRLDPQDLIPHTFDGYRVISGDLYDLRFLDTHLQTYANEPLVVGLAYKSPGNIKLSVDGSKFELDPATCALLLDEDVTREYTEVARLGVGFVVPRLSLGYTVDIAEDDVKKCFSLFITAENPSQDATFNLLEKLTEIDIERCQIDSVTCATETGLAMNISDGAQTLQFRMSELIKEPLETLVEVTDSED